MTDPKLLASLRQEQRHVKEKIVFADAKIERLNSILAKKQYVHSHHLTADEATFTKLGSSIAEYRIKTMLRSLPVLKGRDLDNIEPQTVTNPRILKIREHNLQRTVCRQMIFERTREKERAHEEFERRHRARSYPNIKIPVSMLPNRYIRGELPCTIEHGINGQFLSWACPLENLDYEYYLPVFFDGLQCKQQPIEFLARQGIEDLLYAAHGDPERVISCIKSLIRPLRNALSKFDVPILLTVLKVIQQLLQVGKGVGEALLPHAKQFMAPMAAFLDCTKNTGDNIDYGQRRRDDIGEEVMMTLEMMEEHGGPRAFEQIKFCIPTYQSCVRPAHGHHDKKKRSLSAPLAGRRKV